MLHGLILVLVHVIIVWGVEHVEAVVAILVHVVLVGGVHGAAHGEVVPPLLF